MFRSLAVRVLIGLFLGLGIGALCGAIGNDGLTEAAGVVEAVGGLWLNAAGTFFSPKDSKISRYRETSGFLSNWVMSEFAKLERYTH